MGDDGLKLPLHLDLPIAVSTHDLRQDGCSLHMELERRTAVRRELEVFIREKARSPRLQRLIELLFMLPTQNAHLEVSFYVFRYFLPGRTFDPDRRFEHDVTLSGDSSQIHDHRIVDEVFLFTFLPSFPRRFLPKEITIIRIHTGSRRHSAHQRPADE